MTDRQTDRKAGKQAYRQAKVYPATSDDVDSKDKRVKDSTAQNSNALLFGGMFDGLYGTRLRGILLFLYNINSTAQKVLNVVKSKAPIKQKHLESANIFPTKKQTHDHVRSFFPTACSLCVMVVLHFALQSNYQYIHIAMKWSYH
jgi:hypothetical protein